MGVGEVHPEGELEGGSARRLLWRGGLRPAGDELEPASQRQQLFQHEIFRV